MTTASYFCRRATRVIIWDFPLNIPCKIWSVLAWSRNEKNIISICALLASHDELSVFFLLHPRKCCNKCLTVLAKPAPELTTTAPEAESISTSVSIPASTSAFFTLVIVASSTTWSGQRNQPSNNRPDFTLNKGAESHGRRSRWLVR